jgi:hypothetical protein
VKLVRALTAAALAVVAAGAIQVATAPGASASMHVSDCTACWFVISD